MQALLRRLPGGPRAETAPPINAQTNAAIKGLLKEMSSESTESRAVRTAQLQREASRESAKMWMKKEASNQSNAKPKPEGSNQSSSTTNGKQPRIEKSTEDGKWHAAREEWHVYNTANFYHHHDGSCDVA